METMEMRPKTEEEWLIFGDKCLKLFHKFLRAKSSRKSICKIVDIGGKKRIGQGDITNSFVEHFYNSLVLRESHI